MKKFYFFICTLLFFNFSFSQNSEIKIVGGNLVPTPYYYCTPPTLNFEVDDFFSAAAVTDSSKQISDFNSILNDLTNEQNIIFRAGTVPDNEFSTTIDLGFSFRFFNKTYTHLVVGSNGRLVFAEKAVLDNLNGKTDYIDRTFSGNRLPLQENPPPAPPTPITPGTPIPSTKYNRIYNTGDVDRELKMAQIFAGYTKLKVNSPTGNYKYKKFNDVVSGKGILITFQSVVPTNGIGGDLGPIYTSRVIIFEDGRIVLNVQNKTAGLYNAILGMQDEDGNLKIIPDNFFKYNNQNWASQSSVAYVITTGSTRTPTYLWELDRNNDGTIDQISSTRFFPNYTPSSDVEKLSVKISFAETTDIQTSEVLFRKIKTPIIEGTLNCVYDMKVNDATYDASLSYTWYRVGETSPVGSGRNLSLQRQGGIIGDYYVKISNFDGSTLCAGSNESNKLTFNKQKFPGLVKNSYCVTDNSITPPATKTINLFDQFYPKYNSASGLEPYQILFYTNTGVVSDADAANFVIPANSELNLQFGVKESTGAYTCHNGGLTLNYLSMPPTKTISLCSSVTTYNLKAVFQNPSYTSYSYYYTYTDDGSVADGNAIDVSKTVNVKTSAANCSTNTIVNFVLGATVTLPNVPIQERCKGSDNNSNRFNFNLIKTTLDPTNQYDIKFYIKDTGQEIIPIAGAPVTIPNLNLAGYFWSSQSGDFLVYAKVIDRADPSCFSVSNDIILRVYSKPSITIQNPISLKNCQGNTIFNLTQNVSSLTDADSLINVRLEYYSSSNVLLSNADIVQYDESVLGANPYIKVIYNVSCSDIIPFNLTYNPKPVSIKSQILICSELNYSLQNFKNEVIANSANYTFTDLSNDPLPANFDLSSLPKTVKYLIKNNATGCISDPQTLTFTQGGSSALSATETDYILCDADFDGKIPFNLDSKKSIFTNDVSATFEYFKDANLTQSISSNYTNETAFAQTIFVRITLPGFCPSKAKINLKVNIPTKSTTLQPEYFICYGETLSIDAGTENTIFTWIDGKGTGQTASFTKPGNYSILLQNGINGCPYTHNFTISDINQPKIQVINQTNNSIEVIAEGGSKPYTYYFNGVPQSSNTLMNPTQNSYEIQVKSNTGCLGAPKMVYFIKINNAFSPNGDGINDVWRIENLDKMEQVSIVIVNRNGTKVFESNSPSKSEWDGKHNGRELPTSSYWYVISWFDGVTQKTEQRQGWILLKNRN